MKRKEYKIYLNIAGFNIVILFPVKSELNTNIFLKDEIVKRYEGFLPDKPPARIDYEIQFTEGKRIPNINKNAAITSGSINKNGNIIVINNQINIFQFQYILRTVLQTLLKNHHGFFLHASANNINDKANLFLGKNRAGKSTISQLIHDKYSVLADDMVIVKKENNIFKLYQSPYMEKNQNFKRGSGYYIIDRIFFLKKASFCKLEKIENKKLILLKVLSQLYTDKESKIKQVGYIFDLISRVNKFYFLYFTKNGEKLKNLL